MKRSLVLILVISFVLSLAGSALAFPVDFSGDIRFQFRSWDDGINLNNRDGFTGGLTQNRELARIRLNFSTPVEKDVTLFSRLATRAWFGAEGNSGNEGLLDQYGVKIADSGWTYKLGRQAVSLGQGSVISTGDDVGIDNKFDGLVAAGKMGKVDTQFIVGRTTATSTDNSDDWFSVRTNWWGADFSVPVSDTLTIGATYAASKYLDNWYALIGDTGSASYSTPDATKYLGFNATFSPSANLTFSGEYIKASHGYSPLTNIYANSKVTNDKAYFIAGTYRWDKDTLTIQYNNVGVSSVDAFNSGIGAVAYPFWGTYLAYAYQGENDFIDSKYSGFTYTYSHQINKAATFSVCYMDLKNDISKGNDKEYAAGVKWSF